MINLEPDICKSKDFLKFVKKETKVKSHTDPMTPLLVVVNYFFINDSEEFENCPVCQSSTPTSKIILCDRCDTEMCFSCAKIDELPTGKWYCSSGCEEQISKCSYCKLKGHNIRTCPDKFKSTEIKVRKSPLKMIHPIPKCLEIKSKGWLNNFKDLTRRPRIRKPSNKSLEAFSNMNNHDMSKTTNILKLRKGQQLWGNWKKSIDKDGFKLWWPCEVVGIKSDNRYDLMYEDGDIEIDVKYYCIRKTCPIG